MATISSSVPDWRQAVACSQLSLPDNGIKLKPLRRIIGSLVAMFLLFFRVRGGCHMMLLGLIGASRRSAWWVVAVVPFESSSLSQLVQSSMRLPESASEDLRVLDHFAGSRCSLQPTRYPVLSSRSGFAQSIIRASRLSPELRLNPARLGNFTFS